ncbi:MAG: glutamate formiminotransferase [Actinomycetota bacterium]|nr:glutamate formiminotransferase [Actinomycetota bacterium]
MLECVVNVSEGRRPDVIATIASAAGHNLLDLHVDADHNRAVLTLAGGDDCEDAVRSVTRHAVAAIDLNNHAGAHPRLGAVDVVPFIPLGTTPLEGAMAARDRFVAWAAAELELPVFVYGPERPLPEVRRRAFVDLMPDAGPSARHPSAGAVCVGARGVLVAYNLWLAPGLDTEVARAVAAAVRGPAVRALGLDVGGRAQVSMNLVDPLTVGPAQVYDAVSSRVAVDRAELVGLAPAAVVDAVVAQRWAELDIDPSRTIEFRLAERVIGDR